MKITCNVIQNLLPSYLDGICSEDSCIIIEDHMNICSDCQKKLEDLKNPVPFPHAADNVKAKNPLKKLKKKHRIHLIAAVICTCILILISSMIVQHVGVIHDYFYPSIRASINYETNQSEWTQLVFAGKKFLNFSSIFYDKKIVNDANSSGTITIRILDTQGNLILNQTSISPGESYKLNFLKTSTDYVVETKGEKGSFFLNFY